MKSYTLRSLARSLKDFGEKSVQADVRVHGLDRLDKNAAVLFVPASYTRLELLALPFALGRATGKNVALWLAPDHLRGRVARALLEHALPVTETPHHESALAYVLLSGAEHALALAAPALRPHAHAWPRPGKPARNGAETEPHPLLDASRTALRMERVRRAMLDADGGASPEARNNAWQCAGLQGDAPTTPPAPKLLVIPVAVTILPLRPRADALARFARRVATRGNGLRGLDDVLLDDTDLGEGATLDIVAGTPLDPADFLQDADGGAARLAAACAEGAAGLPMLNVEHAVAALLRHQAGPRVEERVLRNRLFLLGDAIRREGHPWRHESLETEHQDAVFDEPCPALDRFLQNLEALGQLRRENGRLVKTGGLQARPALPHRLGPDTLLHTLARALAAAPGVADAARLVARTPGLFVYRRVRDHFLDGDQRQFEEAYALHYDPEYSKRPEVGRPYFLKPLRPRAGVVLVHGYMAAPMEVRALADDLYARGYAVYGVRMAGHGTSPEDLALRSWEDWYAAMNTGWAIMQTVADRIVVSGFSTGGCVALLAAARKGPRVWATVPICAPLQVRQSSIRLVPSILTVNSLLKRMGTSRFMHREFVDNVPENPHINYTRNPLTGLRQLVDIMHATQEILPEVHTPALVMQGSDDPTIMPSSAQQIFEGIAAKDKELTVFGRDRHGIINGDGAEDLFERMGQWLERLRAKEAAAAGEDSAAAG